MRQLLTFARRTASTARAAALSLVAPTKLFQAPAAPAAEPTDLFTEADMPAVEDIAAAASSFHRAADQARSADRGKRAARKILDRLPVGTYGAWKVERTPSSRQTADLDEIRRIFKAHGLGPVPMKASAPSLKVTRAVVAVAPIDDEIAQLAAALRVPSETAAAA